jgi:hypothetical protein
MTTREFFNKIKSLDIEISERESSTTDHFTLKKELK